MKMIPYFFVLIMVTIIICKRVKTNKTLFISIQIIGVIFIENIRSTKPWIPSVEELIKLAHSSLKGELLINIRYNNVEFKISTLLL